MTRQERLMPGGVPRYIRAYDNGGKSADRYTIVYTGNYTGKTGGSHWYVRCSEDPYHPQGVGQHGESSDLIDRPRSSHLGKRVRFGQLPELVRQLVVDDYRCLWDL